MMEESKADEKVRKIRGIRLDEMTGDILCHNASNVVLDECGNTTGFINALNQAIDSTRLYNTKTQREIFSLLWHQASNLSIGNYVETQGVCSSTMVGAKGIGKTASLKLFSATAQYAFKNVIEIYVSFNNAFSSGCPLLQKSVLSVVVDELKRIGIELRDDLSEPMLGQRLISALIRHGVYLHLIVDELDQAYKIDGKEYPEVIRSLHDLSYFGNQPSGRIAVLVCGSSAMIQNLITTNADDKIREEFILLKTGATNLNGNKFITKRVYSTLPIDLEAVACIVDEVYSELNMPYLRLIAYATGCSARNVQRVIKDLNPDLDLLGLATPENSLSGGNTASARRFILWQKIMKRMRKNNRTVCNELFPIGANVGEIVRNIVSINWEVSFQPLYFDEILVIWKKLIRKGLVDNSENLSYDLLHFADRNWITIDGIRNSKPNRIFPFAMASLGNYILDENIVPTLSQHIQETLSKGASAVAKLATNPRVVATGLAVGLGAPVAACGCTVS
jgi:hypothetical protein